MGYYITLEDADFVIPAEHREEALAIFKRMNETTPPSGKRGGRHEGGRQTAAWFSWMPESFDHYTDVAQVLQDLGFDCEEEDNGDLAIMSYDSKAGQEDLFIAALAPFVAEGSFIEWRGEEGARWKEVVRGGKVLTYNGKVVYGDED